MSQIEAQAAALQAEKAEKAAPKKKEEESKKDERPRFAIEFTLTKAITGEKTVKQIKSALKDTFAKYGAIDEIKVVPGAEADTQAVYILFVGRLFELGKKMFEDFEKNGKAVLEVYDAKVDVTKGDETKGSGGGAQSGTAKGKPKDAGRGRGGRGGAGRGGRGGAEGAGRGGRGGRGGAAGGRGGRGGSEGAAARGGRGGAAAADKPKRGK